MAQSDKPMQGKVCLVTGAASGIGAAVNTLTHSQPTTTQPLPADCGRRARNILIAKQLKN